MNGRARMRYRWYHMVDRCTKPEHPEWKNYGARGITVCDEWLSSFEAFYAYMGDPPGGGLSMDRIDNDGNYEPGNVRWATAAEQTANRRRRTHCVNGHPFDEANTYVNPSTGSRACKTCHNDRTREYQRVRRGGLKGVKTHCPQGHPYDEQNTHYARGTGWRSCKECRRQSVRRRRQAAA